MHLIIDGIDTVYTPKDTEYEQTWHGLQTAVAGGIAFDGSNVPEVFAPIVTAGFKPDFEAPVSNVPAELAEHLADNPMSDWKVLLADLRQQKHGKVIPVHVAKSRYTVHQNKELFDCMVNSAKSVLGDNGFDIVSLGTLGAYSPFFVSLLIKKEGQFKVGKGDVWQCFFNLNSSHNGLIASTRNLGLIRQVCWNTVNAAIAQAEAAATIRHTEKSVELLTPEVFAADLKTWLTERDNWQRQMVALKSQKLALDGFRAFAAGVFTNDGSDKLSTTSFNRIAEMESLFARGKGNKGESVYDGINAFTEYFTSGAGVGNPARVKLAKRIASANFGRGNDWKLEAVRCATTEESLADTLKRGERLYADRLLVEGAKN